MSHFVLNNKLLLPSSIKDVPKEKLFEMAQITPEVEKTFCNFCPHLEKKSIEKLNYSSYACTLCKIGTALRPRFISQKQKNSTPFVEKPLWCPITARHNDNTNKDMHTIYDVTPHLKFDDIKLGEIYVVPPILGRNLKIIRITSKYSTYVRGEILNKKYTYSPSYESVYSMDVEAKYIVPLRAVSSPFPK